MSNGNPDHRQSVLATLPSCPACGAKDRARVTGGTVRPLGRTSPYKVQYVECQDCGHEFKIEWE